MTDRYENAGYGGGNIGFGERPVVLVIDFQKVFTQPEYALGRSTFVHKAVAETATLLEVARRCNVPVAKAYTAYGSPKDMPYWKVASMSENFFYGDAATEYDPQVHDPDYDYTFCKSAPSIFFNSPLMTFLAKQQVDTTIITGCTTSGCVRASIIDSFSYGYRTIVAEECVGDVEQGPHDDNLRDVERRYCDVVPMADVIAYFEDIRKLNA